MSVTLMFIVFYYMWSIIKYILIERHQILEAFPVDEITYINLRPYKSCSSHNHKLIWPIDWAAMVQYPVVWGVQIEKRKLLGGWHTHVACHFNEIYYGWHAIKFTQVVVGKKLNGSCFLC